MPCLVAFYNNDDGTREVVGFATIERDSEYNLHPRMIEVNYLVVALRFQKGGIGTKLLAILNEAWDLRLHCWEKQKWGRGWTRNPAFPYYLKLGFTLRKDKTYDFDVPSEQRNAPDVHFHTFERRSSVLPKLDDDVIEVSDEPAVPVASSVPSNAEPAKPKKKRKSGASGHQAMFDEWLALQARDAPK